MIQESYDPVITDVEGKNHEAPSFGASAMKENTSEEDPLVKQDNSW